VSRQTLSTWINAHISFIAERNRRRKANDHARASRFEHAHDFAIEVVIRLLESGDSALALRVFQSYAAQALLSGDPVGLTTPVGVSAKVVSEERADFETESLQHSALVFMVEDLSRGSSDQRER